MLLCADVGGTNTRLHLFRVPDSASAWMEVKFRCSFCIAFARRPTPRWCPQSAWFTRPAAQSSVAKLDPAYTMKARRPSTPMFSTILSQRQAWNTISLPCSSHEQVAQDFLKKAAHSISVGLGMPDAQVANKEKEECPVSRRCFLTRPPPYLGCFAVAGVVVDNKPETC